MDPNACLDKVLEALTDKRFGVADTHAAYLCDWLRKGGFPPRRSAEIELNRAMTSDGIEPEMVRFVDDLSQMLKGEE